MVGPEIEPSEITKPPNPSTIPRSDGGNTSVRIAVPSAIIIIAAPTACRTRNAISISTFCAVPHNIEQNVEKIGRAHV